MITEQELEHVKEYLKTVNTVSARELQKVCDKEGLWAYNVITHFRKLGYLTLNDVYGNYNVNND